MLTISKSLSAGQARTYHAREFTAGHLTIFLTRTRGPFWTIRPAKVLWIAVLGTQIVATLIAVYGLFMTPLGWKYAGFVWGYAIVWALFTDRLKLLAYRILDPSELPLLAKKLPNLESEISKEAYELYQERARGESQQNQDWLEAEKMMKVKHAGMDKAA